MTVKDKNLNYIFYDIGVTSNHTDNWLLTQGILSNRSNKGTILSVSNQSTENYARANIGNTSDPADFEPPYVVEFDIIEWTGNVRYIHWHIARNVNKTFINLGITSNNHMKIIDTGNKVEFYRDNILVDTFNNQSSGKNVEGFNIIDGSMIYKNFMIYSI